MKYLVSLLLIAYLISGCQTEVAENKEVLIDSALLKELVIRGINGSQEANDSLSGLINSDFPANSNYTKIEIDSFTFNSRSFFTVLIQYPNPLYNRFAVYDKTLKSYLIDQSLNGNLFLSSFQNRNYFYLRINESFITSRDAKVSRVSIYKIDEESIQLAFRTYTKLTMPNNSYFQKVLVFTNDSIITQINSSRYSILNNRKDNFIYQPGEKKFISKSNIFDGFIKQRVELRNSEYDDEIISDESSALSSIGIKLKKSFSINLNDDWKEIGNYKMSEHIDTMVSAFKYINRSLGSEIFIIDISGNDSSENYIDTKLGSVAEGNYKVRYSDKVKAGKNFIQYFEYSCGDKKFLLVFKASRFTYNNNKKNYEYIINSFNIDC
jgi:hypothetical protein